MAMTIYYDMMIGDKLVSKSREVDADNIDDAIKKLKEYHWWNLICNFTTQPPKKVWIYPKPHFEDEV